MTVIPSGRTISIRELLANALLPISVTPFGTITLCMEEFPKKASSPMLFSAAGNVTVVSNTGNGYNHESVTQCPVLVDNSDGVEVDAITGATVTSKAIARSVNSAVAVVTGADAASAATTWGG